MTMLTIHFHSILLMGKCQNQPFCNGQFVVYALLPTGDNKSGLPVQRFVVLPPTWWHKRLNRWILENHPLVKLPFVEFVNFRLLLYCW